MRWIKLANSQDANEGERERKGKNSNPIYIFIFYDSMETDCRRMIRSVSECNSFGTSVSGEIIQRQFPLLLFQKDEEKKFSFMLYVKMGAFNMTSFDNFLYKSVIMDFFPFRTKIKKCSRKFRDLNSSSAKLSILPFSLTFCWFICWSFVLDMFFSIVCSVSGTIKRRVYVYLYSYKIL